MSLTIAIVAASAILRWDVPEAGSYYLLSTDDFKHYYVEAANHVDGACQAAATIPASQLHRLFTVVFQPDEGQAAGSAPEQ